MARIFLAGDRKSSIRAMRLAADLKSKSQVSNLHEIEDKAVALSVASGRVIKA